MGGTRVKKALKFLALLVAGFIIAVIFILIVDLSNDVDYKVIEEEDRGDSYSIRVETDATAAEDLEVIVKDVKSKYDDKDAVWLWIYNDGESPIAKARIPYNNKGQIMVGADSLDYIVEIVK